MRRFPIHTKSPVPTALRRWPRVVAQPPASRGQDRQSAAERYLDDLVAIRRAIVLRQRFVQRRPLAQVLAVDDVDIGLPQHVGPERLGEVAPLRPLPLETRKDG